MSLADFGFADPGPVDAAYACLDCGRMRSPKAVRCLHCHHAYQRRDRERARLLVRQGHTIEEVARHLGLAVSTVKGALRDRYPD